MATPVAERAKQQGEHLTPRIEKNAVISQRRRSKRPIPATRREADTLFGPTPRISGKPCSGPRLMRLQQLGLLPRITNGEAHAMILDAMYDEAGNLRVDPSIQAVRADSV